MSNDDANRIFPSIFNAYEILVDAEKRRFYDASLHIYEVINIDDDSSDNDESDEHNNGDDGNGRNVNEDRPPEKDSSWFPCD